MYKLDIEIKGLPKSINQMRGHWRTFQNEAKKWKNAVAHACVAAGRPDTPLTQAKITFVRCSASQPDYDNLVHSFKSSLDGLREIGIISNDSHKEIGASTYRWEKASPRQGKIKIIVEERSTHEIKEKSHEEKNV